MYKIECMESASLGRKPNHPSGRVQPVTVGLSPHHIRILDGLVKKTGRTRSGLVARLLEAHEHEIRKDGKK